MRCCGDKLCILYFSLGATFSSASDVPERIEVHRIQVSRVRQLIASVAVFLDSRFNRRRWWLLRWPLLGSTARGDVVRSHGQGGAGGVGTVAHPGYKRLRGRMAKIIASGTFVAVSYSRPTVPPSARATRSSSATSGGCPAASRYRSRSPPMVRARSPKVSG